MCRVAILACAVVIWLGECASAHDFGFQPGGPRAAVQRRQVDAGIQFLRAEIAMLEARLTEYGSIRRFDRGNALVFSHQEARLMLLDRKLRLATLLDYQRALGRSRAW